MLADDVPLIGRYVETRRDADDPRVESYLRLAGRVTGVRGSRLILEDHGEGPSSIEASDAYLEPRIENMVFCVGHYAGSRARRVLEQADSAANRQLAGPERLDFIGKTFDYLRKQTRDRTRRAYRSRPHRGQNVGEPTVEIRAYHQAASCF
jgi:hypothetical protein